MPEIESYYYGRAREAAYAGGCGPALQFVADWRAGALTCLGCGRAIGPGADLRGGVRGAWHPQCRVKDQVKPSANVKNATAQRKATAILAGTACLFAPATCHVEDHNFAGVERFHPSAFDQSIERGGVQLCVNHFAALSGVFLSIGNEGGRLRFRFALDAAGVYERTTLQRFKDGAVHGCSVKFTPRRSRYDGVVREHTECDLIEISLMTAGHRPAWYGTEAYLIEEL